MAHTQQHQAICWKDSRVIGMIVGGLTLGFVLGFVVRGGGESTQITKITQDHQGLTKPLLGFEYKDKKDFAEFKPLADNLKRNITDIKKASKGVDAVSVYFRELDNGKWVGVNEEESYYPASLMKISVLLAYFKKAEEDPTLLNRHFTYTRTLEATITDDQNYPPEQTLAVGQSYTIEEALRRMIVYSDNRSAISLYSMLPQKALEEVLHDVSLPVAAIDTKYTISPRQYSFFFRFLYNSTYLNQTLSERALQLLSQATFSTGITAPLPSNITVAHKFGNYTNDQTREEELHDCGIVYYQPDPYFLCVMTKGHDGEQEMAAIRQISLTIFEDVSRRFPTDQ